MKYILLILVVIVIYLFRKPSIKFSRNNNEIISPAYGKIYKIQNINNHLCISIILTVFDVHFQYVPCNGYISNIVYDKNGIYNIVYNDYDKTKYNEKIIYEINTNNGIVYVYQIAGFFFRRTWNFVRKNQYVKKGENLGVITFGSRVDICLPNNNLTLMVTEGEYINAGDGVGFYS